MCMKMENENCNGVCGDCVYYFEETDFCLNHMYSVIGTVENCADKKSKADFPATTLVSNEELDFSEELTDWRDEDITIAELLDEYLGSLKLNNLRQEQN